MRERLLIPVAPTSLSGTYEADRIWSVRQRSQAGSPPPLYGSKVPAKIGSEIVEALFAGQPYEPVEPNAQLIEFD